ncbi:MAG: ribosomal protein S18 acetylase RimI-like enzyme [Flavobacteriales bacterium]|jgi:ribosomal protein S18 acetylase RimI-like enzyme
MKLVIANTGEQCQLISDLAYTIYPKHYSQYVEMSNIIHFLDHYQTADCIFSEIENGIRYFLIEFNNESLGYIAIEQKDECLHLYKLYLLESSRGKGLGKFAMNWIISEAKRLVIKSIELIVNQKNKGSIEFYQSYGFEITDSYEQKYVDNFVNLDHKMKLSL